VGPDRVLLTTLLYPFTRSMVPHSGDEEFFLILIRPGAIDHGLTRVLQTG
jgi:hypothetical protein